MAMTLSVGWSSGHLLPAWRSSPGFKLVDVAASRHHSIGLLATGAVDVWDMGGKTSPSDVLVNDRPKRFDVVKVVAGLDHALALTKLGALVAWSMNLAGQCNVPAHRVGEVFRAMAAGSDHSVAMTSCGRLLIWGTLWGERPAFEHNTANFDFSGPSLQLAGGYGFGVAVSHTGRLGLWARGAKFLAPPPSLADGELVVQISAGEKHCVALTSSGRAVAWGKSATC